ncbi:transcriptional repressor DicA [compost metagenome]
MASDLLQALVAFDLMRTNSLRFALARRRRGIKKRELASRIGVTERSVSSYESGTQEPEAATMTRIAQALGFPEAFFFGDDPEIPIPDVASFRSLSKMSAARLPRKATAPMSRSRCT